MATKPSDLLNSMPSVAELLERPPVRALVDRWNRSVVAGGVRSFLDELRGDLARRAADAGLPSIRELAERAAKHVIQMQQPSLRPAINATGRLLDPSWGGSPLADHALERVVALGRGYVESASNVSSDIAAALVRLTGAEAATVVHSYSCANWLALAALAGGKRVVVARTETGDVDPGCSLITLAESASVRLREVGSANRAAVADYEAAVTRKSAAIFRHEPDGYCLLGDESAAELEELVALARDRELPLVNVIGSAPLVGSLPTIGDSIRSAASAIAAGAHLVVVRGDGLVGGPPCGIVLGHRELVQRIAQHPLFAASRPNVLTSAALAATLQLYDDVPQLSESLPLVQLLSASVENLRLRAKRLAPQLAEAPGVKSAEPMATENGLGIARFGEVVLPSYAVALSVADDDPRMFDKQLRVAPLPVVGRIDGPRLIIDLRTLFPRQDQQIVAAIVANGAAPAAPATTLATASV
jgi:L-seryl-tRNA(Ser) seleniumtransferase